MTPPVIVVERTSLWLLRRLGLYFRATASADPDASVAHGSLACARSGVFRSNSKDVAMMAAREATKNLRQRVVVMSALVSGTGAGGQATRVPCSARRCDVAPPQS